MSIAPFSTPDSSAALAPAGRAGAGFRSLGPRALTLVLAGLLCGACGWFSWIPGIGGDKDDDKVKLKPAKLVDFRPEISIDRVWRGSVGSGLGRKYLRMDPVILTDSIYAADGYGVVEARNRFTGKRLWRVRVDPASPEKRRIFSGVRVFDRRDRSWVGGIGVGAGHVLLGTTDGELIALSPGSGAEVWRVALGSEILCRPTGSADTVFLQTIDGRLLALEARDGAVRWSFDIQTPVLTLRGTASPVVADGVVYAGFSNGMVTAIRAETGEPLWDHRIMLPEGRSELSRIVDVDGAPLIEGGLLFAVAFQGRLKALRRTDGGLLWQHQVSSHLDLAAGFSEIYVVDEDDAVVAINQQTAQEVWRQEGLARRKLSSPAAFNNYVVVGDSEGYLHVLAQSDGRFLARRKLDGKGIRSGMVVAEGRTLYVLGNSGDLVALELSVR